MRFFLFIIISLWTVSCEINKQRYQRDPKWDLADKVYDNEIARKVFCQLTKDKKLQVCESGWCLRGKKKIQVMHCGFFYYDELDVDQARELLLRAGNLYLTAINENEKIRPLLEIYPFTPKNIEISIFLQNRDGSKFSLEKLCIASIENGMLRYRIGALDPNGYFTVICEEQYEEAMRKNSSSSKSDQ
jgi:hypothetical protein